MTKIKKEGGNVFFLDFMEMIHFNQGTYKMQI